MNTPLKKLQQVRSERGAALVEFALVLPLFLVLLLGMFDFGKAFNYWIDGTHLSHEGVRFAAVNKNPGPGSTLAESIKLRADTAELRDGSASVTEPIRVCVNFPNGAKVGEPVEVTVEFTYEFLGYVNATFPDLTSATVTNKSTMRIERPPTFVAHCA